VLEALGEKSLNLSEKDILTIIRGVEEGESKIFEKITPRKISNEEEEEGDSSDESESESSVNDEDGGSKSSSYKSNQRNNASSKYELKSTVEKTP
jgi:hypothetical protein